MSLIIPLFVPNQGCPQRCLYCNEEKALGVAPAQITAKSFHETLASYLAGNRRKPGPVQIAFYGGNFTGMARKLQRELLEMAGSYISKGLVDSVRISTRPDYIDAEGLDFLKKYHVKTVEIGVQSLVDDVLRLARRGHGVADVRRALQLLKRCGFETGVHLMVGLPGDSPEGFAFTVRETIALAPDTVRIHPTLVFSGTGLAEDWARGNYQPLGLAEAITACKHALCEFTAAGIPVIRLGLQTTPEMEKPGSIIAGPYHPAFRVLVEEAVFFDMANRLLSGLSIDGREVTFFLSPRDISSFRGQKNENLQAIKERFALPSFSLSIDQAQPRGTLTVALAGRKGPMVSMSTLVS